MNNIQQWEANNLIRSLFTNLPGSPIVKVAFSLIPYLAILLIFLLITYFLRKLIALKVSLTEKLILLEITPPSLTEKEAYTTEQLFSLIQALGRQKSLRDKLLGRKTFLSLEIVSTRNEGIRYLVGTTAKNSLFLLALYLIHDKRV